MTWIQRRTRPAKKTSPSPGIGLWLALATVVGVTCRTRVSGSIAARYWGR
jgi:hypothetical protein